MLFNLTPVKDLLILGLSLLRDWQQRSRFPALLHFWIRILSQGSALFDFYSTAAAWISRTERAKPTLLTMPGGDEEEARVEEDAKNEEKRRCMAREYMRTTQW